ncbi:MAG TPA: glycosyltransferase family 39 protein [Pirellulales bacterium]|jgi:4-amino-4-deoxy-L-arabinose transferase-like glycosyltransferase|nr:glycosyltransferase family 39 protein [Pirellulales bacterium]
MATGAQEAMPERTGAAEPAGTLALAPRSIAVIAAFGLSMLLVNIGVSRVLTYHEVVFAQAAKEMLTTGDFVVPKIGGVPFTDKPPLTAWSIAASMTLFRSDAEWVVRLPSVLASVITALILAGLVARWLGNDLAIFAGLVHLTTVHVMQQARLAESDTLLTVVVAAAIAVFAVANVDSPRGRPTHRWLPWLFYALVGLSFLAKLTAGPVFILGACGGFVLLQRQWRGLKFLLDPIGIIVAGAIMLGWLVPLSQRYWPAIDSLVMHSFGRFQGAMGTHDYPFSYLYQVPMLMLPWTPVVIGGVIRAAYLGRFREPFWRLMACWFVVGMIVLQASSFKSKHYTIPLLAPLALLGAYGGSEYLKWRYRTGAARTGWMAAGLAIGSAAAAGVALRMNDCYPHVLAALLILMGVGLVAAVAFERRRWLVGELAAVFGTIWLISVGVQTWIMPSHDTYRAQAELAGRINQRIGADEPIYMLNLRDNQITYYLHPQVVRLDDEQEFPERLAANGANAAWVLAPRHVAEQLVAAGGAETLDRCPYLNSYLTERDRLTFLRWQGPGLSWQGAAADAKVQGTGSHVSPTARTR